MKFNVGDKVRVREWDDMEKEFGLDIVGDINCRPIFFVRSMRYYCGKVLTISEVNDRSYYMVEDDGDWNWSDDMLIPAEESEKPEKTETFKKFKVGDIVTCIGNDMLRGDSLIGKSGKVIHYEEDSVCVEFFEDIGGHDGSLKVENGKPGHCWYLPPRKLKKGERVTGYMDTDGYAYSTAAADLKEVVIQCQKFALKTDTAEVWVDGGKLPYTKIIVNGVEFVRKDNE